MKKPFLNILFRGLELKKITVEGRKLVGEEVGLETIERELAASLNQAYPFVHLEFSYEATTIGNWTFGLHFRPENLLKPSLDEGDMAV